LKIVQSKSYSLQLDYRGVSELEVGGTFLQLSRPSI
jgi:hypothetical protein